MRGELETKEQAIATLTAELDEVKERKEFYKIVSQRKDEEIERLNNAIAKLKTQLEQTSQPTLPLITDSLDPTVEQLQPEKSENLEEQTPAVTVEPETEPETEQPTVTSQESAISDQSSVPSEEPTINSQQLTLDLKPEPVNPEPEPKTETVDSNKLLKYIDKNSPDSGVKYPDIRDAIRDKDKKAKGSDKSRLAILEEKYNFKFLGKIDGKNQFLIPKKIDRIESTNSLK